MSEVTITIRPSISILGSREPFAISFSSYHQLVKWLIREGQYISRIYRIVEG